MKLSRLTEKVITDRQKIFLDRSYTAFISMSRLDSTRFAEPDFPTPFLHRRSQDIDMLIKEAYDLFKEIFLAGIFTNKKVRFKAQLKARFLGVFVVFL